MIKETYKQIIFTDNVRKLKKELRKNNNIFIGNINNTNYLGYNELTDILEQNGFTFNNEYMHISMFLDIINSLQNIKYDISAKQKEIAEKLTLLNKEKTEKELEELLHQQKLIEFALQQEAGIQTVGEINYSLEHGQNFIYETTGSGHFPQRLLKRAKNEYGYKIATYSHMTT